MKRVLILCSSNTCQSQMAEAYLNFFAGHLAEAQSAGFNPAPIRADVIDVMSEDNIDISGYAPKSVDELPHRYYHYLITLVDDHTDEKIPLPANLSFDEHLRFYLPGPDHFGGGYEGLRQTRETVKKAFLQFIGRHLIPEPEALSMACY
jgi:arsenate reductase